MKLSVRIFLTAIFVSSLMALSPWAQPSASKQDSAGHGASCAHDPSWTAPQKPFRIYGNTWYVGPRGLGVILITAASGHILIDGGVPGGAPLIEANIRSLGFNPRDIKWILNSHAHCDHAGDIAQLVRETGAQVIASAADSPLLARGGLDDPQYGDRLPFPPVQVTWQVSDNESLRLGDLVLTVYSTPGHTKGNTTWTWKSCEGARCLQMVFVGSLSAPDFKLVNNPNYPLIVKDFKRSFKMVENLPCDIALAPHPGMVDFWERFDKREQGTTDAMIDSTLCRAYAKDAREDFEEALAKQRRAAASSR